MFVTSSQFYVVCASISYGVLCGVVYQLLNCLKKFISLDFISWIIDFATFILFSLGFIVFSHIFSFPNFRLYMPLGVFCGLFLYLKSFGIILAKITNKGYNIFNKRFKGKLKYDRKQI